MCVNSKMDAKEITTETKSTQGNTEFFVSLRDFVPPWFKKLNQEMRHLVSFLIFNY